MLLIAAMPAMASSYPRLSDRSKYGKMGEADLDDQVRRTARLRNFSRRIVRHSSHMVGANYRPDPLGEGIGGAVDKDPRFRLAPVDCLTFVEATLALSLSGTLAQAKAWMDRLRYSGGQVAFGRRNHFMLAQWLPHLQRRRVLRDITRRVGKGETMEHDYSAFKWEQIAERFLPTNFDKMVPPSEKFTLPLLDIDTLEANIQRVPTGTVLLLVRVERPRIPVRISHLGFVIHRRDGRTIFRHASQEGWGRVVDEDLIAYLRRLDERSRWAIQGVNLQLPRHPRVGPGAMREPDPLAFHRSGH